MNKSFTFEAEEESPATAPPLPSQSPWEFSSYSHTVAEEHLQRRTTSVDDKISRAQAWKNKLRVLKQKKSKENTEGNIRRAVDGDHDDESDSEHSDGSTDEDDEFHDEDDEAEDSVFRQKNANGKRRERNAYNAPMEADTVGEESDDGQSSIELRKAHDHYERDSDDMDDDSEQEDKNSDADEGGTASKKKTAKQKTKRLKEKQNPGNGKVHGHNFFSSSEGASFKANSFLELNLSRPLVRACEALGYEKPTPIQAACIPLALTGRDICGSAVTGSGKTAAFALPLLERLLFRPKRIPAIRVLILTPTRELAVQVHSMIEKLAQFTDVRCCLIVGGLSSKVQEVSLRSHPDIVVATPGRMIDHLHNTHSVGLEDLAILILDEADRLLELGFANEVQELVRLCPRKRQTMLFSATMTEEVNELVKLSLVNPVRLSADPSTQRPRTLQEEVVKIRPQHEGDREAVLLALCSRTFKSKVIIFSGTKVEAHRLKILFGLSGLRAAELHGNLTQAQRLDALELFRKGEVDFLIATDVAARGLDIVGVETVINFECPRDITTYVHRVGRTARAGQQGCAVTFISEKDRPLLKLVVKRAGSKLTSRVVPVSTIMKWHDKIIGMEDSVRCVIQEEREERALRKAEMEANKAQNLIDHEAEIYARPKRVWFQTSQEKRKNASAAKAAKLAVSNSDGNLKSESMKEAVDEKKTKKRFRDSEKNLTRKQRRRLEAAQEAIEESDGDEPIGLKSKSSKGKQGGATMADLAYRRAKAAKAVDKARLSGKFRRAGLSHDKQRPNLHREKKKKAEMEELFQDDMNKAKKAQRSHLKGGRKPGVPKKAFKSKARYKRR